MHRVWLALIRTTALALCCVASRALAQDAPPAADDSAPSGATSRADEAPPEAAPTPTAPAAATTSDAPAPSAAPARQPEAPPAGARYEGQIGTEGGSAYDETYGPDDADQAPDDDAHDGGFKMPGFSIRLDPFNWLLEGRLGIELEVVAWNFISIEMVPVIVANTEPPSFNFSGRDDPISQHSNGLGPISGASLGAGFWLSGTPLEGYVVRTLITNYGYTYKASANGKVFDSVNHTERRFEVLIGSQSRFSFFTIAGAIGLGYELNQDERCIVNRGLATMTAATSGCPDSGEMQIEIDPKDGSIADLNGGLHPFYIVGRFSLGVSFD